MERKIPVPVPLKHHTETAFLVTLALAIAVTGFLLSMLQPLPASLPYAMTVFAATVIYPIVLLPTFRRNRADYEFRLLHWYPAMMSSAWLILQFLGPKVWILMILNLGFFFSWSISVVVFGILFICLFVVHVLRRSTSRLFFLSVIMVVFCIGSFLAETSSWNRRMKNRFYPKNVARVVAFIQNGGVRLSRLIYRPESQSGALQGSQTSSTSSVTRSQASSVSSRRSSSVSSSSPADVPVPTNLPKSGPESAFVLLTLILSLYSGVLHSRFEHRS